MKKNVTALLFLAILIVTTNFAFSSTVFVKYDASGLNNGTSWVNAFTSFQSALDAALSGDVIWVAAGTYKPTSDHGLGGGARFYHFRMKNNLAIYGGFTGNENPSTFDLANRSFLTNETILSGDLNNNGRDDNDCYHLIFHPTNIGLNTTAILDGFTISGGNANGADDHSYGGGIFLRINSPLFRNLKVVDNYATTAGGGIALIGTEFSGKANATVINALFANNSAGSYGGVFINSSSPTITNTTIVKNSAFTFDVGGIGAGNFSNVVLNNCIIWGNTAVRNYNQIYSGAGGNFTVRNSNYSLFSNDVYILSPILTNIINSNPKFLNFDGNDFRLTGTSPSVNTGNNTYNTQSSDIRGYARIQNTTIDMGAYEWTSGVDPEGAIVFVDASKANDNGDGYSWSSAKKTFQAALNLATVGENIWVAKGTYKPSSAYDLTNTSRFYHFRMKNGVKIYGGLAGDEDPTTFDLANRNLGTNETVLSGDIGTENDNSDNCYHVFYHPIGLGLTSSAIIDGFTITGGNADGSNPHFFGGGIYNNSNSPTIRNCIINENSALYGGGVMNNNSSSPVITNSTISSNSSNSGGGVMNDNSSSPVITSSIIIENSALYYGGGIYNNSSSPILTNVTVSNNTATDGGGGGIFNQFSSPILKNVIISNNSTATGSGGGIFLSNGSSPILNNVTIANNMAAYGGGIANHSSSAPVLNNCIIWGNSASTAIYGKQFYVASGTVTLNYSCYANGTNDIYVGNYSTFTATNNNITSDPQFVDATNDDFRLFGTSPAVNYGNNTYNAEITDIRGEQRIQNTTIDMGAYEWTSGADPESPCSNPTDGGEIADDQTICYDTTPEEIESTSLPTGHIGDLEYKWQFAILDPDDIDFEESDWNDIASSNAVNYQPEELTQTTWYRRLARVDCETVWSGAAESNVIRVAILPSTVYVSVDYDVDTEGWGVSHFADVDDILDLGCSDITVNISGYSYTGNINMSGYTFIIGDEDFVLNGTLSGGMIQTTGNGKLLLPAVQNVTRTFPITDGSINFTVSITPLSGSTSGFIGVKLNTNKEVDGALKSPTTFWDLYGNENLNATVVLRLEKSVLDGTVIPENAIMRFWNGTRYAPIPSERTTITDFGTYYEITLTGINYFNNNF